MSVVNRSGIAADYECALIDVQCLVNETGLELTFEPSVETDIRRGSYRSIRRNEPSSTITVYSYPTEFSPNTKSIERAGLREDVDVIAYTPFKTWRDNNYTFRNLDLIRWEVQIDGQTYTVREKTLYDQLGAGYLYVIFGLSKK